MAINETTTVPKVIAANLLSAFRQSNVYSARVNNSYRSLLNAGGESVIINTPGAASVSDYAVNGTVTYSDADVGTPINLSLSKTKQWAVKFDDLNASISRPDVLASAVAEHGRALAEQVDKDVQKAMVDGASAGVTLADTDSNANNLGIDSLKLSAMHRLMDLRNMPRAGRWVIVGPYTAELVQAIALKDSVLMSSAQTSGLTNGSLGSFAGFNWYVAPGSFSMFQKNQKKATETLLYGVDSATAFIDTISKTERIRLQTTFADAVRGLYRYGYSVIQPNNLFKSSLVITNVAV